MLQTASEQKNFIVLAFCTHYVGGADLESGLLWIVSFLSSKEDENRKICVFKEIMQTQGICAVLTVGCIVF